MARRGRGKGGSGAHASVAWGAVLGWSTGAGAELGWSTGAVAVLGWSAPEERQRPTPALPLCCLAAEHGQHLRKWDPAVTRRLHSGYTSGTRRLHIGYTAVTQRLHSGYTSVT